ncbi:inter-alpha-trypsin inhibitor heavy chain H3-like [Spea bombifrons]|uniref:inter-alpha-trypsin inhibitor heavy chain H3-like n=1 Tax=Spea bombifrons TaxID=233779 RepID=UPI00234A8549|nr:inter-alpha-trypsin inhibitor heavy chain H3-like [Spea bombifrons]
MAVLRGYLLLCLGALVTSHPVTEGQRSLQPVDDVKFYAIDISAKVTSRFARNVITSRAVNYAKVSKEVSFDVDLPKTAFITNFSMVIDGVSYPGVIKEKETAKKQYEKAVSRGQSAGLVRASGRKTEKFSVSVNVASQSKVTFQLVYEEMLKRNMGKYEMFIKVKPKTLVDSFQIEVDIYEPQGISFLEAAGTFITNDLLPVVKKSFSGKKGRVSFMPTINQQRSCLTCATTLLDGDFTVTYDVNRESAGNIQIVNGYFVHFFAPPNLPKVPKNVVFVIDRSGSMWGRKMEQTQEALLEILKDVKESDHINFISFDSAIDLWKDSMVKATLQNVEEARNFVRNLTPRGATNINDPVLKAAELLHQAHERNELPPRSASLIILLTDGQVNTGEVNLERIQQNVKIAIQGKCALYSLGFGYGVDYAFLEKLALENSGLTRRIYEDSDAALQLQGFYDEVANPTLLDVEVQYPENMVSDLTQNTFKHFFDGSEIVVAGRLVNNDLNSFTSEVKAEGMANSLNYIESVDLQEKNDTLKQQEYIFGDFSERLWAYLTIQQLLEKRISSVGSEKSNLTSEILDLSLKYNFVTPLTSMVVTKPEEKEAEEETLIADKFVEGVLAPGGVTRPMISIPKARGHASVPQLETKPNKSVGRVAGMLTWFPGDPWRFLGIRGVSWGSMAFPGDPTSEISNTECKESDGCLKKMRLKFQQINFLLFAYSAGNPPPYSAPTHNANYQHYSSSSSPTFVDSDPHFVIQVPRKRDALCFNIQEKPGAVLSLITDPELGISVNGELIGNKNANSSVLSNETYFGKFGIINKAMELEIEVNPETITVLSGGEKRLFSWQETLSLREDGLEMQINRKKNVLFTMGEGLRFVVILHKVWKNHPLHRDFLGFYTLDNHRFSPKVHGLLGQFFHGIDYEIFNIHKTSEPLKPDASMLVKSRVLTVTRGTQRDYMRDAQSGRKVPCWFVHYNGQGLIDGAHTDYLVPALLSSTRATAVI